jgi:hypothetical protein
MYSYSNTKRGNSKDLDILLTNKLTCYIGAYPLSSKQARYKNSSEQPISKERETGNLNKQNRISAQDKDSNRIFNSTLKVPTLTLKVFLSHPISLFLLPLREKYDFLLTSFQTTKAVCEVVFV